MSMSYKIATLGCKVNQQESETLSASFENRGFIPARKGEAADVCVINSCTVTSIADSKTRQKIRQARKNNPMALICVAGCLTETSREAVMAMPEVDLAVGSLEKEKTAEIVMEILEARSRQSLIELSFSPPTTRRDCSVRASSRTRAFIKIEDGCDRFCAYCIVPYARGPVRSRPLNEVLDDVKDFLEAGYKEIVLTGINLAMYEYDLYELVKRICGIEAFGEFRVRLGSLEPTVFSKDEAVRIARIKGVCPQFHLSLQSGAKKTLNEMGRPYTPDEYAEIVMALREIDPLFSITTDIIVGFPGETEADFEENLDFVRRMEFAKIHVFKYSKRPGTRAAEMVYQVPEHVKNERSSRMQEAQGRFLKKNIGQKRRTLIFGPDKSGNHIRGLTDNGIDVLMVDADYKPNTFVDIELKEDYYGNEL